VAIAGFYDDVREPSPARLEEIARLEFDEAGFAAEIGIESLSGEAGFGALERLWLQPTCEVNGIAGGYTGEGAKTVIPSTAFAEVSFRLVAEQTPQRVERQLRAHLDRLRIPGMRLDLRRLQGALPWTTASDGPGVRAARRALATAFDRPAVIGGAGGTIPIVPELTRSLDAEILLVGFGLPGENAHAPNEWLDLDTFRRGVRAVVQLYEELGQAGGREGVRA
jgi:acetylornithine deacetylase/succinyl-diaminopimelate desuccinylase-like protein